MLPALEGVDNLVPWAAREPLAKWAAAGAVSVSRVDLPEASVGDPLARMHIERRWIETSPLRRAAHSALAFLESCGTGFDKVHIIGRGFPEADVKHVVGFRWSGLNIIRETLMHSDESEWLEIPVPAMRPPLIALHIEVLDRDVLADQSSL